MYNWNEDEVDKTFRMLKKHPWHSLQDVPWEVMQNWRNSKKENNYTNFISILSQFGWTFPEWLSFIGK